MDGPHDYRSQLICLQLARRYLSESAAIIVDDCNYPHVRLANRDFLVANPEYKLLFEAYTDRHPLNMSGEDWQQARRGWWNGINVTVRDLDAVLSPMYPPTERDRTLHVNEHAVHSLKRGRLAPVAIGPVSSMIDLRLVAAARHTARLLRRSRRQPAGSTGRYAAMNTFSEGLQRQRANPALAAAASSPPGPAPAGPIGS